jgi:hypothetical protein
LGIDARDFKDLPNLTPPITEHTSPASMLFWSPYGNHGAPTLKVAGWMAVFMKVFNWQTVRVDLCSNAHQVCNRPLVQMMLNNLFRHQIQVNASRTN